MKIQEAGSVPITQKWKRNMAVSSPLVSVIIVTYNHEQYIARAIQSVLDQTHQDLEVVLVNDGSTDATEKIVSSFTDSRLRATHQINQGPSVATNNALALCRGKYVALMSGDDLYAPDRIEKQLRAYKQGPSRLLFSQMAFIDDNGRPIETDYCKEYYKNNLTPAWGRARVLRRLFDQQAPAASPTLFTETAILKAEPVFCEPALYQLQDFEWLIRLAKKYDFDYLEDKLYLYRIREGHANLSGPAPEKIIRTRNEVYLMMRSFFDGISPETFKAMFPDLVRNPNFSTSVEHQCEQAFVLLKSPYAPVRLLGAERLYDLLRNPEGKKVLQHKYNYTCVSFADTIKRMDVERMFSTTTLCLETVTGGNDDEVIRVPVDQGAESFNLRFPISTSSPMRMVHWIPVVEKYCKVWLTSLSYEDLSGQKKSFDMSKALCNGFYLSDGSYLFTRDDPRFSLPVEDALSAVVIQGRWSFVDPVLRDQIRASTLYFDQGQGLRQDLSVAQAVLVNGKSFELRFEASRFGALEKLRWDPLEGCACKVKLHEVIYHDASGTHQSLDLERVTSNGERLGRYEYLFETTDPMFFFPISGTINEIIIRGQWECLFSEAEVQAARRKQDGPRRPSRPLQRIIHSGMKRLARLSDRIGLG